MPKPITLRIQSPDHGTKRVDVMSDDVSTRLQDLVTSAFDLGDASWQLYRNRNNTDEVKLTRKRIKSIGLSHGDILYIRARRNAVPPQSDVAPIASVPADPLQTGQVFVDQIDRLLELEDGKISRPMDKQLCRHGPQGKCFHCVPYEPFDEKYLASCDPPIKFLSFHSYLRKLRSGADKGKFVHLENLSCRIRPGCTDHPPWPAGICTKCQPNAVTLTRQTYRHVDNVMFENAAIMDGFLNFWRETGCQRIGYLVGRYERHPDMPLAIRATVCAIYEPPQVSERGSVELLEAAEDDALMDWLLGHLGMQRVGWVFTDLLALDLTRGTVKHFRGNTDSHFLSAEECIMAATLQNKYPNPCRLASEGVFGSKFVTVVVTGNKDNQISFEAYQVTDQCMGLVRDNCLVPTYDCPELGYIRESSSEQYVPDVFYKEVDKYGNAVTQLGRPLPVEFLLVDMSVAFSKEQTYTLTSSRSKGRQAFPSAQQLGPNSPANSLTALRAYLDQFDCTKGPGFLQAISDLNLLLFLARCDIVPLKDHMVSLLKMIRSRDADQAHRWSLTEEWKTLVSLLEASPVGSSRSTVTPVGVAGEQAVSAPYTGRNPSLPPLTTGTWECKHCTFLNSSSKGVCEICSLPK